MKYFIGVAGTHSTGKSTFVAKLQERAVSLGITVASVGDTASECRARGFGILREHTFESTLWIMCSVIRAELQAALTADLILVDRPVPDALGYLEAALDATGRFIDQSERTYLYKLAEMHTPRYSLLFKTVLDTTIPLGDGRDSDLEFRQSADIRISRVLENLNITPQDPNDAKTLKALDRLLRRL